jgi:hypothetical protein
MEGKARVLHKESCLLAAAISVILCSLLGGFVGLLFSRPLLGALAGAIICLACYYRKTEAMYSCPEHHLPLKIRVADDEKQREEWVCPKCDYKLIATHN